MPTQGFSQDIDSDGWTIAAGDCDDDNNAIHPGAEEIPGNAIDENCDGSDACTCYTDADTDGFGDPYSPFFSLDCDCADPNEASTGTDCDDTNNGIHPGVMDVCGDGIDSNCDGIGGGGNNADEDLDGLTLVKENALGTSDCDTDSDNDGLADNIEDYDNDGVKDATETNAAMLDSDGDGLNDGIEDANHNGLSDSGETDPLDNDTDGDGLLDGSEDLDHDGIVDASESNPLDADSDDDGIDDSDESAMGLNKIMSDTDGDVLNDGQEIGRNMPVAPGTSNVRGVSYLGTDMMVWRFDANTSSKTDPLDADSDDDGISDGTEDIDHDGLVDASETNPADADHDDDGLRDGDEDLNDNGILDAVETDPRDSDSDNDGLNDGLEKGMSSPIAGGTSSGAYAPNRIAYTGTLAGWTGDLDPVTTTNPRSTDTDGDGLTDDVEDANHNGVVDAGETDPNDSDSDDDLSLDGADCQPLNPTIYPGAPEIVADGIDQDCDGGDICYRDADNDGYRPDGTSTVASADCDCADASEAGDADPIGDCDDSQASIHPGASEIIGDGIDQDCSGGELCYHDEDSDGYGGTGTISSADLDCFDAYESMFATDCNDALSSIHPGATEIVADGIDQDCDGGDICYTDADDDGYRPDATSTVVSADCDCADQYEATAADPTNDCDDARADIYPNAPEIPGDGLDQDCNGVDAIYCFQDVDQDGYGDIAGTTVIALDGSCDTFDGESFNMMDCDDNESEINPGAIEIPGDGIDEDCNGYEYCFVDSDGDTHGSTDMFETPVMECFLVGGSDVSDDCDDYFSEAYPGHPEVCDGADNDCDGFVDNNAIDVQTWYLDNDWDGYGNPALFVLECFQPGGYVSNDFDCDDNYGNVYPGATEFCDGLDNDCDGVTDDNAVDSPIWYADSDEDGYGDPGIFVFSCNPGPGYTLNDWSWDCDDTDNSVYPGAIEYCDGKDNDCNGIEDDYAIDAPLWYFDGDSDGYGDPYNSVSECNPSPGYVGNNQDCDDSNSNVYPGAPEICDGWDNDCNGTVDDNALDAMWWYVDNDWDGYGFTLDSIYACVPPYGYVDNKLDCDDNNQSTYPYAIEICDGEDNDCDGDIDENVEWAPFWYADTDVDGYGNPFETIQSCTMPLGYVENNMDCDDSDEYINPDAYEFCNGLDDNCDGGIDEGYDSYIYDENYSICQGQTYTWHGNTYSSAGNYTDITETVYGCEVYNLHLTVNPIYFSAESAEICSGSAYLWQDSVYTTAGTHVYNPLTAEGCDSIFELTLTVNPGSGYAFHDTVAICSDDNFSWHGDNYFSSGIYEDHYLTQAGCDSTYFLHLTVNPSYHFNLTTNAIIGETVNWHGQAITASGTYYDSFVTQAGCDSIYAVTIYFKEPILSELWGVSMEGGPNNAGFIYKTDGNGDNLTAVHYFDAEGYYPDGGLTAGPDGLLYGMTLVGGDLDGGVIYSIDPVTENIEVQHSFSPFDFGYPSGTMLLASNNKLYGMTLSDIENCVGTLFEFDPSIGLFETKAQLNIQSGCQPSGVTLAEGSNHVLYGVTQSGGTNGGGVVFGYDYNSETYTVLNNFSSGGSNGNITLASDGNLYGIHLAENSLFKYVSPGVIEIMHQFGTDSLGRHPQGRLEADSAGMLWGITRDGGGSDAGILYSYDTEYSQFTKLADLASIGTEKPLGSLTRTSNGKLYGVTNGVIGGEGGVLFQYDPLTDSLVSKFTFGISEEGYVSNPKLIEVCQRPQFSHNLSALDLCNPSDTMLYVNVSGNGISYTWQADFGSGYSNLSNDAVYSGVNNDTLHISGANSAMNGYVYRCVVSSTCPSINVNSNSSELNIRSEYNFNETASICTGSAYLWQNNIYNAAGTYYAHYNSMYGCDSTYQLTLTTTAGTGYAFNDTASICDGDIYTWRGMPYTESGIYQDSYTTLAGCDSSYFLHLNINPIYEFNDVATICEGGAMLWHGEIYDYEGIYHKYYTSSLGCDSVYHLTLDVDYNVYEELGFYSLETAQICNGSSYLWMGNVYTEAGLYEVHRPIFEGYGLCDSAFFLDLHVIGGPGFTQRDTLEICGGDTAFWQGGNYIESGFYVMPYLTQGGCDSTYYLNLTVHPSYHYADVFNSIIGDTVEWRGQLYSSNDSVVEHYSTVHGCDSIYSFVIHFYPRYEGPDSTQLWGMTRDGGANNLGCIFKTDDNGENQTVVYSFEQSGGTNPYGSLFYASNGKLYGMTSSGGLNNMGTLFEYDLANNIYTDDFSFDAINGASPVGSLIEGSNGLLYGMTKKGGDLDQGVIFSFDPVSHHVQKLVDLADYNMNHPNGSLTLAADGNFWGQSLGGNPMYSEFFGMWYESTLGVVFEYNPTTGAVETLEQMDGMATGFFPSGTLVQSSVNQMLYGVTIGGPTAFEYYPVPISHNGTLFTVQAGQSINTIHTFEFDNENQGSIPVGGLVEAANGNLYGLTSEGGSFDAGVLYEYNPNSSMQAIKINLAAVLTGSAPMSPMMKTCDGKLFGMTSEGGEYGFGTIFRYDVNLNTLIKTHDFDGTNGASPQYSSLTEIPAVMRIISQPADISVCHESDQMITVIANGNYLTYQWQMSSGSGFSDISNNSVFTGATSSMLQINDAPDTINGVHFRCVLTSQCPVKSITSDSMMLQVNPIYMIEENHAICHGETYLWQGNNYSDNGTFYAHYNTMHSCDSTYKLILSVHELPFVYAGSDLNICEGSTISLTGSGTANQYNWNNNVVNSMSFQPLASNTYIVTGTDLLTGCKDYDTVHVQLQPTPVVDAGIALTVCEGDSVTLTASGTATTFVWNNGVTNNVPFVVTNSDVFTVTGYDAYGCSNQDFTLVSVTPVPAVALILNDTVFCLTDNPMYLSGIPSAGTFYGTGVSGNMFYPDVAGPGDHNIIYSYTNGGGCTGFDTTIVSVNDCTGLDENDLFNVSIYPNPTSGQLTITFPAEDDYTLSFIQKEQISAQKTVQFDLNSVAPGVYMLKIENAEGFVLKRVVVE
ncbi:MAG: hypothetical protein A2W93_03740 [Bacteroidetes bacterium GWF2_43_63]|nr:MAG: hypothetical protein A2W93_03740 [Bacteroidetes bacterium GWF2_43_63]